MTCSVDPPWASLHERWVHPYTDSGGKGSTAIDQEDAVALMLEKHEVCCGLFQGFDWSLWLTGKPHVPVVHIAPLGRGHDTPTSP
ncbi:MAG: DUF3387 domain-containing protein [Polyangiaceae bacterium]|nr:DUF3387 domain-containing protein [Polyangiaceae bacterium]